MWLVSCGGCNCGLEAFVKWRGCGTFLRTTEILACLHPRQSNKFPKAPHQHHRLPASFTSAHLSGFYSHARLSTFHRQYGAPNGSFRSCELFHSAGARTIRFLRPNVRRWRWTPTPATAEREERFAMVPEPIRSRYVLILLFSLSSPSGYKLTLSQHIVRTIFAPAPYPASTSHTTALALGMDLRTRLSLAMVLPCVLARVDIETGRL
jgi:hypothetical protein